MTHKDTYNVLNEKSYFLNLLINNETLEDVTHLSFKQKEHRAYLNYLYDFKSENIGRERIMPLISSLIINQKVIFITISLFSLLFLNTRLKSLNT